MLKRRIPAIHLPGGDCFQMLLQRTQCAGEDFWPHLPGQGLSRTCRMDVGREGELREVSQVRGRGARVPDAGDSRLRKEKREGQPGGRLVTAPV